MQALPPTPPAAEAIIVTGKALPDAEASRAYDVDTIGFKELTDSPTHQLDQLLKQVPGLQLYRRSDSTSGHPTSQGVTLRALGGNASSRALLILDGVPQSDPFGGWIDWPAYDSAGLERVRVIRGGGSVPYGSGALAGVIDMSSLASVGATASVEAGSRNSVAAHGYLGEPVGRSLLTLDVQAARSDGFIPVTVETRGPVDEAAPYREASIHSRFVAPVAKYVELQASGLGFIDLRNRGVPFTGNRTRGADASLRLVGSGRWQWSATGYSQWRNFKSSFASVNDDRTSAAQVALQDSVPSHGIGGSIEVRPPVGGGFELRLGADSRFTSGESRELYLYEEGDPTHRRISGGTTETEGAFAEATVVRGPLTLSGGARIDHWQIANGHLIERVIATGTATRDDQFPGRSGWRPTARAGAVIGLGSGLSLRSAAYLGWRLPTLNELFRPYRVGADATAADAMLDPERLAGAEAGLGYRRKTFDLAVTGFVNRLSDAIANVTLGQGPGVFPGVGFVTGFYQQRQNLDSIRVFGLEASGQAHRGPWSLRLGASYSDARVQASGVSAPLDGLRPAQTPMLTVTGEAGWSDRGRSATIAVRHVGSQFEDDLNQHLIAPAMTIDAFAQWPLTGTIQLIVRGENLLDSTVVTGIGGDGTVEQATPRTLWIGFRLMSL